jgi:hypothetical protein
MRRAVSISPLYSDDASSGLSDKSITGIRPIASLVEKVRTVKVSYINDELLEEHDYKEKKAKKKRVVLDVIDGSQTLTFEYGVEMPIAGTLMRDKRLALSLREVKDGDLSESCLELDSLRYVSIEEEMVRNQKLECSTGGAGNDGSIQILDEKTLIEGLSGVVVSSVGRGGVAWGLGIRAGDLLVATSATIGNVSSIMSDADQVELYHYTFHIKRPFLIITVFAFRKSGQRALWKESGQQYLHGKSCQSLCR